MARLSTKLVNLKRQLAIAERREEYQQQELQRKIDNNIVTPYEGKGPTTTFYVPSIDDPADLYVRVEVPTTSLTECLGGADATALGKVGGVLTLPAGAGEVPQRGFANKYMSLKFIHRDTTPVATQTPWGSRVVKYYTEKNGQATRMIPIGGASISAILTRWKALKTANFAPFTKGDIQLLAPDNSVIESASVA